MASYIQVRRDYFECSICFHSYDAASHYPMILPCLHGFCKECIEGVVNGANVVCPNCSTTFPRDGVQRDFKIKSQLDEYQALQKKQHEEMGSELVCQMCELRKDVVSRCDDCKNLMCTSCERYHVKKFPDHKRRTVNAIADRIKKKLKVMKGKCEIMGEKSKVLANELTERKTKIERRRTAAIIDIQSSRDVINNYYDRLIRSLNEQVDQYKDSVSKKESRLISKCNTLEQVTGKLEELLLLDNSKQVIHKGPIIEEEVEKDMKSVKAELSTGETICEITVHKPRNLKLEDLITIEVQVSEASKPRSYLQHDEPDDRTVNDYQIQFKNITRKQYSVIQTLSCNQAHRLRSDGNCMYLTGLKQLDVYNMEGKLVESVVYQHCSDPMVISSLCLDKNNFIIADSDQGLYHINQSGKVFAKLFHGDICDVSECKSKIFALEYTNGIVYVFTKKGNSFIKQEEIQLDKFHNGNYWDRLCVNDNAIFVSICNNNSVYKYSHTGQLLCTYGRGGVDEHGTTRGLLCGPLLCDLDTNGALLVADCCNHRLQICKPNGRWLVTTLPADVENPRDVVVYSEQHLLWVLTDDNELHNLQVTS